jgi:hypothetical protein
LRGDRGDRMRFEVKVCQVERQWEVRAGDGAPMHFATQWAALTHARNVARMAYIDDGILTSVRVLTANGFWETDTLFGGESGDYYRGG